MNLVKFDYSGKLAVPGARLAAIYRLEAKIMERPQRDCPVRDIYAPGIYAREMTIPPWTVISGAVHKAEHMAILSHGRIEVETEDGMVMLTAPHTFMSTASIKRIGRTFEEGAVWTTIHENPDNCRDMDVIVERLCTSKNSELLGNRPALKEVEKCHLG